MLFFLSNASMPDFLLGTKLYIRVRENPRLFFRLILPSGRASTKKPDGRSRQQPRDPYIHVRLPYSLVFVVVLIEALEVNDLAWPPCKHRRQRRGQWPCFNFSLGPILLGVCHQAWILLKKHMVYVCRRRRCCCACVCKYILRTENRFFRGSDAFRDGPQEAGVYRVRRFRRARDRESPIVLAGRRRDRASSCERWMGKN